MLMVTLMDTMTLPVKDHCMFVLGLSDLYGTKSILSSLHNPWSACKLYIYNFHVLQNLQIQPVCLEANANKPCIEDAANAANKPQLEQKPISSDSVTRPTTADNPKISASTEDSEKSFNVYALSKLGIKKEYLRT